MKRSIIVSTVCTVLMAGTPLAGQAPNPMVTMSVTRPDGKTAQLSAPESGLATITLSDGTEIGFRPTILDSKPWTRVIVTMFKMATATHPTEEIGQVEVTTGAAAGQAKTAPPFKVAVTRGSEPAQ